MRRTTPVLLIALVLGLLAPVGAASASCVFIDRPVEERLSEFTYVFKGRVIGLRDDDRTARFAVEEVWRGTLGPETVVYGGPEQDAGFGETVATSVDRSWTGGATYLVFAGTEPRGLVDNACSPTQEWTDELAAARPVDWTEPDRSLAADDGSGTIGELGIVALVLVALLGAVGAAVSVRRRRRTARRPPASSGANLGTTAAEVPMTALRIVAAIATLTMLGTIAYGFSNGDFSREGAILLDLAWGRVTMIDLYLAFAAVWAWIAWRERRLRSAAVWLVLVAGTGSFAIWAYVLLASLRSRTVSELLVGPARAESSVATL